MLAATLPRRDAANHLRPVSKPLLGVEGACVAGHPLGDDARVPVDENTHARLPSICLHASSNSFTASTLTWKLALAVSSSWISTMRSTPSAPITTGTPT